MALVLLTNYGDGLPGEPEAASQAHVLAAAARCPQTDDVLQTEKHNQDDLLQQHETTRPVVAFLVGKTQP